MNNFSRTTFALAMSIAAFLAICMFNTFTHISGITKYSVIFFAFIGVVSFYALPTVYEPTEINNPKSWALWGILAAVKTLILVFLLWSFCIVVSELLILNKISIFEGAMGILFKLTLGAILLFLPAYLLCTFFGMLWGLYYGYSHKSKIKPNQSIKRDA